MRLEKFPPDQVGPLLDSATGVFGNMLCMLPTFGMMAGILLVGIIRVSNPLILAALWAGGGGLSIICGIIGLLYPTAPGNVYLRRLATRVIYRRNDRWVEPKDPHSAFVEIVPRSNWGTMNGLDTATEVGFLRVDEKKREVLFEGNGERWRIPAVALLSCSVEDGPPAVPGLTSPYSYVVLVAMAKEEPFEFPIAPRGSWNGHFIAKTGRRRAATELCERIQSILEKKGP